MFCAGNINHVGIKTLQLILAKVVLLLGVRIIAPCSLVELIEPDDKGSGWKAKVKPENELLANYEFKFLVVASGKNVAVEGFDRRSLDAKLAIALTANFVNNHSAEEAEVRQISGIAKQFHQVILTSLTRWTSPLPKWGTTASSPSSLSVRGQKRAKIKVTGGEFIPFIC